MVQSGIKYYTRRWKSGEINQFGPARFIFWGSMRWWFNSRAKACFTSWSQLLEISKKVDLRRKELSNSSKNDHFNTAAMQAWSISVFLFISRDEESQNTETSLVETYVSIFASQLIWSVVKK